MATTIKMEVGTKQVQADGKVKTVKTGEVDLPLFLLKDFNLAVESNGVDEGGYPTYQDEKVDFIAQALYAAIRADARNKLKAEPNGSTIAQTVEALIAEGQRVGGGAFMKLNKAFCDSFAQFLKAKSNKSVAVQTVFNSLVSIRSRASIVLASQKVRSGLEAQLEAYIEQTSPEEVAQYEGILTGLVESCAGISEELDY